MPETDFMSPYRFISYWIQTNKLGLSQYNRQFADDFSKLILKCGIIIQLSF